MHFDGMEECSERVGSLLNGVGEDWGLLASHMEDYARTSRECARRLCRIWEDTGVSKKEQEREFLDVTEAISMVWGKAVDRAKAKQAGLKARLEAAVQELHQIKCDIGEEDPSTGGPTNNSRYLEGLLGPKGSSSLRAQYNAILEMVSEWHGYREEKMAEFNALRDELARLRHRLGRGPLAGLDQHPFSIQLIGQLKHEIDDLRAEKKSREMELEAILSRLRKVCIELGENDVDVASAAHPSLRFYREALPGLFQNNFRRNQGYPELRVDLRPEDVEIDLSENTFAALEDKIDEARELKMDREQKAGEMSNVLNNLWKVLDVPDDDMDRGIHRRLLEGPTRLHAKSMERCMMEVTRLEKAQAALLKDMIKARIRDLEELCVETHLPMPDVTPLLPTECDDEGLSVGSVSESLGKLMRMVEEVTKLGEKRKSILSMINELESSRGEVEWLIKYEQDEGRYKGRDCNRKLQKALKVGRVRDKMPAMISRLQDAISSWEMSENVPFIFNDEDYRSTLEQFAKELEASVAARKAARTPKPATSKLATGRTPRGPSQSPSPSLQKANSTRAPLSGPVSSKWSAGSGTARGKNSNSAPKKRAPTLGRADSFHTVGRRTPREPSKLPPRPSSIQHNPLQSTGAQEKLNWLMQTAPACSTGPHDSSWRMDTSDGSDMSDHGNSLNAFLTSSEMGDVTWRTGQESPPNESPKNWRSRDMISPSPCGSISRSLTSPCGGLTGRRELTSCRPLGGGAPRNLASPSLRYKDPPKPIVEVNSSIDRLGVLRNSG
ncbi:hypothetical protein BSKO_11226 [Bryopsis sp. KO-2023]|nr:hypothetical protein BSKO_11226 [Bryopsis sp. KO-2023]